MKTGQRPPALEVDASEMVVTERAGAVAWELAQGRRLTNAQIQAMTGMGRSGSWLLMGRLSRVLPVVFVDGKWSALSVIDGFEGNEPQR